MLASCALFFVRQWFLDFGGYQNLPESLLNRFPSPTHGAPDSARLGWGLKMCISNKLPGEVDAADPGTAL